MLVMTIALALDAAGSAVVLGAVVRTSLHYVRTRGSPATLGTQQRDLAQGLVLALTCTSGAGLLRTTLVHGWNDLAHVSAIIALRFALGQVLRRQAAHGDENGPDRGGRPASSA